MTTFLALSRVARCSAVTVAGLGLVGALGCGSDMAAPDPVESANSFWQLRVNHRAITLSTFAPYDTVRLTTTALTGNGSVLDVGTVRYSVRDTAVVVDSTGFVRSHSPAAGVFVVASATVNGLTLRDSVLVNVNAEPTPAQPAALSIRPVGTGEFTGNCSSFLFDQIPIPSLVTDADGHTIPNVAVAFSSAKPELARVADNSYDGSGTAYVNSSCRTGRVMLYASATVYGKTVVDSVPLIVTPPLYVVINIFATHPEGSSVSVSAFNPGTITVGAGAAVTWWNQSRRPIDVVFDTPSAAVSTDTAVGFFPQVAPSGGGNIGSFVDTTDAYAPENYRARRFSTPGTYPYHSSDGKAHGVVIVLPLEPAS